MTNSNKPLPFKADSDTLLNVDKLSIRIDNTWVVEDLSFAMKKGKCLGLVGESGSGKSITAMAIMQLLPPTARVTTNSQILLAQQDLLALTEQQMRSYRGGKIGMIFQDATSAFNPVMTIAQQMQETLRHQTHLTNKQGEDYALNLLAKVGIQETRRCYQAFPHQLSGGMRQRAMIAMALCGKPALIIADEPTTALDVTIQAQVIELLQQLCEDEALTLLFISHNLAIVSHIADDIMVLKQGSCIEKNSVAGFFSQPQHDYSKQLLTAACFSKSLSTPSATQKKTALVNVQQLTTYFYSKRNIKWQRSAVKAVDGVSFSLETATTLALIGESGSGKTTVAKTLAKLYRASSGLVNTGLKEHDIQMLFQDPYGSLNPRRVVADSIMEGMITQKIVTDRNKRLEKVDQLLRQVGLLPEHKWRYPHQFSGGERQRICIARALALNPKLLILDEPTSALDVSIQQQILILLRNLQQQYSISYLLITHDFSVVSYLAHKVAVMHQGHIVETGTTQRVLQHPQHAYTKKLVAAMPSVRSF